MYFYKLKLNHPILSNIILNQCFRCFVVNLYFHPLLTCTLIVFSSVGLKGVVFMKSGWLFWIDYLWHFWHFTDAHLLWATLIRWSAVNKGADGGAWSPVAVTPACCLNLNLGRIDALLMIVDSPTCSIISDLSFSNLQFLPSNFFFCFYLHIY